MLARISVRTLIVKEWKETFWIITGGKLLLYRNKEDYLYVSRPLKHRSNTGRRWLYLWMVCSYLLYPRLVCFCAEPRGRAGQEGHPPARQPALLRGHVQGAWHRATGFSQNFCVLVSHCLCLDRVAKPPVTRSP